MREHAFRTDHRGTGEAWYEDGVFRLRLQAPDGAYVDMTEAMRLTETRAGEWGPAHGLFSESLRAGLVRSQLYAMHPASRAVPLYRLVDLLRWIDSLGR